MQRVSRIVDSSVGYDYLGHCDKNVAKNMGHILNSCCVMIALTDVNALQ